MKQMDNEIIFLRYLDNQLNEIEAEKVEKLISENTEQNEIFEAIKLKRQSTLDALDMLNPEETIIIPSFNTKAIDTGSGETKQPLLMPNFWRYAAAIVFLLGLSFSLWLFNNKQKNLDASHQSEIASVDPGYPDNEELSFYISPNRCWNQRQLVWTVTEMNK